MAIGVVKVERQELRGSNRLYLPAVIGGMLITLKHLLKNLFKSHHSSLSP